MTDTEQIALVLKGEMVLMPLVEAKERYAALEQKRELSSVPLTEDELGMHAALTLSLGTMFDLERIKRDWEASGNKWEGPV